ncbi:hypothetical protein H7F50_11950 [Novosphingobium flavum]|uniref:hypothetical protein n=1 Tax=Novosphingobium aerophilum TaxID=2839843 RepID=UPI00163B1D5F|nr:hypothetical protein [Novosphingobium aerophilum]MBC2662469.1 hypothetical protein [Novosphingobium aerophilum]
MPSPRLQADHARQEDRFTQARAAGDDLAKLRDRMLARTTELTRQARAGGVTPAEVRVLWLAP